MTIADSDRLKGHFELPMCCAFRDFPKASAIFQRVFQYSTAETGNRDPSAGYRSRFAEADCSHSNFSASEPDQ
jgi:hypothetical protein